jgi:AMP nucleosidase
LKTKQEIVANWLPRYTGTPLEEFGQYILLVNFTSYVRLFAERHKVPVRGEDRPMLNATANGISILNFGMGSSGAATVMDLLSARRPKTKKQAGRFDLADRRHPRRRHVE